MKALLKFDLSNEDDMQDYLVCNQAKHYYLAIKDIHEYLRKLVKYNDLEHRELAIAERIRQGFYEILAENDVDLNL